MGCRAGKWILLLPPPRGMFWGRQWHPTPVFLPGKSHGWRSLVGSSPWGRYESDMAERLHVHFSLHALEKEVATHSSALAWSIPGMGEPDGLLSMGLHRVGHDWRDLEAAAAEGCFGSASDHESSWSKGTQSIQVTSSKVLSWCESELQSCNLPPKLQIHLFDWLPFPPSIH